MRQPTPTELLEQYRMMQGQAGVRPAPRVDAGSPFAPFLANPHGNYDRQGQRMTPPEMTIEEADAQTLANRQADPNWIRGSIFDLVNGATGSAGTASLVSAPLTMAPGIEAAVDAEDAYRLFKDGNYKLAALAAGAALIPWVSGAGKGATKLAKKGSKDTVTDALQKYSKEAGSDPRYLGAAPDRSNKTFLRYKPKKTTARVQRSIDAMRDPNNPVRQEMLDTIKRGQEVGGDDWYNTEELRDWFIEELGEEQGEREWRDFIELIGTNSAGSKVDPNIANASAVRQRMLQGADEVMPGSNMTYREAGVRPPNDYNQGLLGVNTLEDAKPLARGRAEGYGHKVQNLQELSTARRERGDWGGQPEMGVSPSDGNWNDQPKPKGFAASLLGNKKNSALDLHFTRYMAMSSRDPDWLESTNDISLEFQRKLLDRYPQTQRFMSTKTVNGKSLPAFNAKAAHKAGAFQLDDDIASYPSIWASKPSKPEYADLEDFMTEIGNELGMTTAQVQANLWMGGAAKTGVDVSSQATFMKVLRNRAAKTAKKTGSTPEKVLQDFIRKGGLLTLGGGMAGAGALNEMSRDRDNAS